MNNNIIIDIKTNLKNILIKKYQADELKELGGYQNFIYEMFKDGKSYVLRITQNNHRNVEEINDELMVLNALKDHKVNVAGVIKLQDCCLIEQFNTENNHYLVTIFEKIGGLNWTEFKSNDKTYYQAGKTLGRIHKVSKTLIKCDNRPSWYDNQYLKHAYEVIPHEDIISKMNDLLDMLNKLPKDNESYGLVHGDYNFANIIYHENDITVIDFDELEYHWYIYDIAVYLFYYLLGGDPQHMDKETNITLFKSFIVGYYEENAIDEFWFEKLPLFFRLREFILLSSIYRSSQGKEFHPWQNAFVTMTEYRIRNDIPFIDIDYVELLNQVRIK